MKHLRRTSLLTTALLAGAAGLVLLAAGRPVRAASITLPPETARWRESPLPGYTLAVAMCSTCHSADYPRMQPPNLSETYWRATVIKMQKTFGAPIPDSAIDPLVEYLTKTYGTGAAAGRAAR